jgi:hypothetical protein
MIYLAISALAKHVKPPCAATYSLWSGDKVTTERRPQLPLAVIPNLVVNLVVSSHTENIQAAATARDYGWPAGKATAEGDPGVPELAPRLVVQLTIRFNGEYV